MSSHIIQTGRKQSGRKARPIIHAGRKFAKPQAPHIIPSGRKLLGGAHPPGRSSSQIKKNNTNKPQARKPRIRRVAGRKPDPLPLYPLTPKSPCKERGGGGGRD